MSRWSEEEILSFLELYEQCPCLWDSGYLEYRRNENRSDAIRWIILKMGQEDLMSEQDLKNKIKNIRTTYMRNLRKLLKCKDKKLFFPSLTWFWKADTILRTEAEMFIVRKEQRKKMMEMDNGCTVNFMDESEDDEIEIIEKNQDSHQGNENHQEQQEIQAYSLSESRCSQKRPLEKEDESSEGPREDGLTLDEESLRIYIRQAQRQLDRLEKKKKNFIEEEEDDPSKDDDTNKTTNKDAKTEEDDFDVFAKHISNQLRQLPVVRALRCQHEIHSLLMRERIDHVAEDNESQQVKTQDLVVGNQVPGDDQLYLDLKYLT